MSTKRKGSKSQTTQFEPLQRSVYCGRLHLGTFEQTDRKRFEAFAACGRRLGAFRSRAATLAAINRSAKVR